MSLMDQWFKNQKLSEKRNKFLEHRMENLIRDSMMSADQKKELLNHLVMISSDVDCSKRAWPILNFVLNTLESRESSDESIW